MLERSVVGEQGACLAGLEVLGGHPSGYLSLG